jgi:hypothetical protein
MRRLAGDMVLDLPWLDGEQASLQFGVTRLFPMMDGTTVEIQMEDRRNECLLMSYYGKIQKIMRKTSPDMGRSAEYYVIDI